MWENNGDTRSQYNLTIHSDNTRRPLQDDHYRTMIHVNIHMTIHNWRTLLTLMILMILVTWVIGDNTRRRYKTPVQDDDGTGRRRFMAQYTWAIHHWRTLLSFLSLLSLMTLMTWVPTRQQPSPAGCKVALSTAVYNWGSHVRDTHQWHTGEQHTVGAHLWRDAVKHDVH